jgi:hypothetical protein
MNSDDDRYLNLILTPLYVCAHYRPKFGQGIRGGGLALAEFQHLYQTDPFYSWFGLDNPLMYAAHKAAGGMTSIYRQIGIGCEALFRVLTTYIGKPPLRDSAPSIFPPIVENGDCAEFCYCAVCNGLGGLRRYFHAENRAAARGHLAITQSCHKASDVTRADRHLVSLPVLNSLKIKVVRA